MTNLKECIRQLMVYLYHATALFLHIWSRQSVLADWQHGLEEIMLLPELERYMEKYVDWTITQIDAYRDSNYSKLVAEAKSYIRKHYQMISLDKVAQHVGLSKYYFSKCFKQILRAVQTSGCRMVGIGYYQESARNFFFTKKAVSKLADLKGMKIRAQDGSMYVELMKAFGASATPIDFSELYSALQTGVVDGAENPLSGYYSNKFNEVAKYYLLDGHELSPNIVLFSGMVWKTLTPADQKLIKAAFAESQKYFEKISGASDRQIMKDLKAKGVHIMKVSDPKNWRQAVKPIYQKYGKDQEKLIEEIQNFKY